MCLKQITNFAITKIKNMSNKAKRNIAFILMLISGLLYVLLIFQAIFGVMKPDWWIWVVLIGCFVVFLGCYRNYSQAMVEDRKYGSINEDKISS